MVAELERKGNLRVMLQEAEERTATEMDDVRRPLSATGIVDGAGATAGLGISPREIPLPAARVLAKS